MKMMGAPEMHNSHKGVHDRNGFCDMSPPCTPVEESKMDLPEHGTVMSHKGSGSEYVFMGVVPDTEQVVLYSYTTGASYTLPQNNFEDYYEVKPDPFFEPGKTYTHISGSTFKVLCIDTHPETGVPIAFGYYRSYLTPNILRGESMHSLYPDQWTVTDE